MRKITFLFYALLFCCFGAAAQTEVTSLDQLSNGKVYAIRSARSASGTYLFSNSDIGYLCSNYNNNDNIYKDKPYVKENNDEFLFVLHKVSTENLPEGGNIKAKGSYYIYSIGADMFIGTPQYGSGNLVAIPMTKYITNKIEIRERNSNGVNGCRFLLSTDEQTALNAAGNYGAVNWDKKNDKDKSSAYDNALDDAGNLYSFVEIDDISDDILRTINQAVANIELGTYLNAAEAYLLQETAPKGAVGTKKGLDFGALKTAKENAETLEEGTKEKLIELLNDIDNMDVVELEPNKYYRIISAYPEFKENKIAAFVYKSDTAPNAVSWGYINNNNGDIDKGNVNAIFQIEEKTATEGTYFIIKHCNKGEYMRAAGGVFEKTAGYDKRVEFVELGGAQYNLYFYYNNTGNCYIGDTDLEKDGAGLKGPSTGGFNTLSAWYIVPATDIEVSMNSDEEKEPHYWASTYLPFEVSADNETTILIGNDVIGDYLTLTEVEGTLPAQKGAILYGTNQTCTLNIVGDATERGVLRGTLIGESIEDGQQDSYFVLGKGNNGVGLYRPNTTKLLANKAYLYDENGVFLVNGLRFSFGEVTGIDNAAAERNADTGAVYDLSGRRVAAPVSGIYVKDGKKIFVR